jgi:purine catabolism regulator
MNIQSPLTVSDILKRPLFRHAKVAAGSRGLHREVKWVHILEIMDGSSYVRGNEMILMTGVGLGEEKELKVQFVRELWESGVSALAIELVHQFVHLSEETKAFADQHAFPIIVFEEPVSFIEITQDIHGDLIHRHHRQLLALERLSHHFHQLALKPQGAINILRLLHQETGYTVRLVDYLGEDLVYPDFQKNPEHLHVFSHPIVVLDVQVGELQMSGSSAPTDFARLVMERAATALAQELLRSISLEERRLRVTQQWIDHLIESGSTRLPKELSAAVDQGGQLAICAVEPRHGNDPDYNHVETMQNIALLKWTHTIRNELAPLGIGVWTAPREGLWVLVLADWTPAANLSFQDRLRRGFDRLSVQSPSWSHLGPFDWKAGISLAFTRWEQAPQAWRQAVAALSLGQPATYGPADDGESIPSAPVVYCEDLHAWQLFLQVSPSVLEQYVEAQIGPLLAYDRENGTQLTRTLEVYLAENLSKQHTANALYIHRQTLYYRLEQIGQLLGKDWDSPVRRLALETALSAHRFLQEQRG